MTTMFLAMWLQEPDPDTRHLIIVFIGLIAVAVLVLTIALVAVAIKAATAMKEMKATADEIKAKLLPLLDDVVAISKTSRELLEDAAPNLKAITENLATATETLKETSQIAKGAVKQIDTTVLDVNLRTQRQVARVDGMVTSALTATVDAVEAISKGLRIPAQKVAAAAGQARFFAEGLLAKVRSAAGARTNNR